MLNIDLCERLLKCREMQDPQQREACERKIGELLGDYFRPYEPIHESQIPVRWPTEQEEAILKLNLSKPIHPQTESDPA